MRIIHFMRIVHFICWLAVPAVTLLCCQAGASAQAVDVRQACTPDAMRLCSAFIPDIPKITACMRAKRAQLSQECRLAMAGGVRRGERRHYSRGYHEYHGKHGHHYHHS